MKHSSFFNYCLDIFLGNVSTSTCRSLVVLIFVEFKWMQNILLQWAIFFGMTNGFTWIIKCQRFFVGFWQLILLLNHYYILFMIASKRFPPSWTYHCINGKEMSTVIISHQIKKKPLPPAEPLRAQRYLGIALCGKSIWQTSSTMSSTTDAALQEMFAVTTLPLPRG